MGNIKQTIKWLEIVNTCVMHDASILAMLGSLHAKFDNELKTLHYSESHHVYLANIDITSWLGAFYVKNEIYEKAMPFFNLATKIEPSEVTKILFPDHKCVVFHSMKFMKHLNAKVFQY